MAAPLPLFPLLMLLCPLTSPGGADAQGFLEVADAARERRPLTPPPRVIARGTGVPEYVRLAEMARGATNEVPVHQQIPEFVKIAESVRRAGSASRGKTTTPPYDTGRDGRRKEFSTTSAAMPFHSSGNGEEVVNGLPFEQPKSEEREDQSVDDRIHFMNWQATTHSSEDYGDDLSGVLLLEKAFVRRSVITQLPKTRAMKVKMDFPSRRIKRSDNHRNMVEGRSLSSANGVVDNRNRFRPIARGRR